MVVTEGVWAGWEVVGWRPGEQPGWWSESFWLGRNTRIGVAACVWSQISSEGVGWAVWGPGSGDPLHRGPETGEAGRRRAEAALREIGIPAGEPDRDPRVNPEHGDVLRFPGGQFGGRCRLHQQRHPPRPQLPVGRLAEVEVERRLRLLAEESERVPEPPRVVGTKTAIVADRRGICERCNADVPVRAAGDGYECADCGAMLLGDFPAELSAPVEGARRPWPKVETKNVGGRGPRVVVSWPDGDGWDLTIPAARELAEGIRDALGLEAPAVATLRRIARAVSAPECEDLAEKLGPEDYEDLVGTVEAMLGDRATGAWRRAPVPRW